MSFLIELWAFMRTSKKFWLLPIVISMLLFGSVLFLAQISAVVAPFLYSLF